MTQTFAPPPRALIFDSGVGGLSILSAARQRLPHCAFDYLSDNAGFPYGDKSDEFVKHRTLSVLARYLERKGPVDVIVVACNTASTVALPLLRERLAMPIVGVVPAIKPAAAASANRYIGLLATPGTIARPYTHNLIREFATHCRVVTAGSTALVRLAEKQLRGQRISHDSLSDILAPLTAPSPANPSPQKLDQLVLACTHFPLLARPIGAVMGPAVTLVDSGAAIAHRIGYWLQSLGYAPGAFTADGGTAFFTAASEDIEALAPALQARGLDCRQVLAHPLG